MEIYGMSGERLGTIGVPVEPKKEDEPEWKKAFKSAPSISVRKGIASNFDPPFENTSTLVLTAPSGKFVDIRLPLGSATGPTDSRPITDDPSFWAFSGTVKISFLEPPATSARPDAVTIPYSAHAVFEHDLDSKGPGIVDEGDMFLLPNGDTIEVGIWTNPSTGKYEMYKEYWTEPEPSPSVGNLDTAALKPEIQLRKSPVIVAETIDAASGRGIIIRIGGFIQGVYQQTAHDLPFLFIRDEYRDQPKLVDAHDAPHHNLSVWQQDPRNTGDKHSFPFELVLDHHSNSQVGDTAHTRDTGSWRITEVWRKP